MNAHGCNFDATPTRRQVMIGVAGLSFAFAFGTSTDAAELATEKSGQTLTPWVSIAPDDVITIMSAATEMGQGSMTSLPLIIAEELDADWDKVRIVPAPVNEAIYGNPGFCNGPLFVNPSFHLRHPFAGALLLSGVGATAAT